MYNESTCQNVENHDGLHFTYYQGEKLRWGVPSQKELYDVIRTK